MENNLQFTKINPAVTVEADCVTDAGRDIVCYRFRVDGEVALAFSLSIAASERLMAETIKALNARYE